MHLKWVYIMCQPCQAPQGGSPGDSLEHKLWSKNTCIWILLLLLTDFVTLGKSWLLSEPQFPDVPGRIHQLQGILGGWEGTVLLGT